MGEGQSAPHATDLLSVRFEAVARAVVKRPLAVLLALVAVTGLLGSFIADLRINNDGRIYFIEGDPMLDAQERFEETFGSEQFVMFFLEGEQIFTREGYETISRLVKRLDELQYKGRPAFSGILDPFHAPALKPGSDSLNIAPILEMEEPTDADLEEAKRLVTGHPVYSKSVVNPEGTIAAVLATLRTIEGDADDYSQYVADHVREIFKTTPGLEKLKARLVGGPVFGAEMNEATAQEAVIYGTASVFVSLLFLFVMFRRPRQVLSALGVVVFATLWTVGIMAATGTEMSLIHTLLPPAIIVTGLGSGIHVINEYRLLVTRMPREQAVYASVGTMSGPCFLTAVTTAIGFLSMLTAPVAPMRSLGLFIAIGVVLSFVLAMLLIPAVLMLGRKDADEQETTSKIREWSDRVFVRMADLVVRHAPPTALAGAVLAAVCMAGLSRVEVDSTFLNALRKDHPFRTTVEYVDEKMGGSSSFELVIDTGVENGIYDPEFLRRLAAMQDWIESTQRDVVWVTLSIADLFKEINYAVIGRRALPDTKAQAAELLFLYDVGGGITANIVDSKKQKARLSARTRQMSSRRSRELEAALRQKADELFGDLRLESEVKRPPPPSPKEDEVEDDIIIIEEEGPAADGPDGDVGERPVEPGDGDEIVIVDDDEDTASPGGPAAMNGGAASAPGGVGQGPSETAPGGNGGNAKTGPPGDASGAASTTGPPVKMEIAGTTPLFAKLNDYIISSQMTSFLLATLVITFLMVFMLRSVKLGLMIMIPNLLPIFSTYGVMGWTGTSVDFLTAVIAVAAIGVAVDGTIHIGIRYRRSRLAGETAATAVNHILTGVGRALVVTSLVLTVGFLVLIPSMLASLATFGVFMALCLFLALLYDLLMTPAVLAWFSPDVKAKPREKT